jgi:sensor c-di-GMP phosphodiesterase-like protein
MNHRQRRRLLLVVTTVAASLLPPLLSVSFGYWEILRETDQQRARYARLALQRAEAIFSDADATLRKLIVAVDAECDLKTQVALAQANHNDLYTREAVLIGGGTVKCAGDSLASTNADLPTGNLPLPKVALDIAAPNTVLPLYSSIVASYPLQKDLALALLINPIRFSETLEPLLDDQRVAVQLLGQNYAPLAEYGWHFGTPQNTAEDLQSSLLLSVRFPIHVVVTTSREAALKANAWALTLYFLAGLAVSGLLIFLVFRGVLRLFAKDSELRDGLANGEFQVHYQPVIDIETGACVGAEALLRWQHPDRGWVSPEVFIPIAEQSGFVIPLTAWLMRRINDEMHGLMNEYPGYHISINLSARHILDPTLLDTIQTIFSEGILPQQIIFEITEQELLHGSHVDVFGTLQKMRGTGALLALDDFGTGYASLRYLTQYPFDYLKIDRYFIQSIGRDAINASLVDATVDIAKRLRLGMVAEGIETLEQLDYVRKLGVKLGQGWLFSKALPAARFFEYVSRRQSEINLQGFDQTPAPQA